MQSNLTINDPLDGQAVSIIVTLPVSKKPKDERQALVSIGLANQMPVIKTGVFGNLTNLIDDSWKAFGVQAETIKAAAKIQEEADAAKAEKKAGTAVSPELIAEVAIQAEAPAVVETKASTPKPASNLGLF